MAKYTRQHCLSIQNRRITYFLIRRKNQRYINIRVSLKGELIVSAPLSTGITEINETLRERHLWIFKNIDRFEILRKNKDPLRRLLLQGIEHEVRVISDCSEKTPQGKILHDIENKTVNIYCDFKDKEKPLLILKRWLREKAKKLAPQKLHHTSKRIGIPFSRITIRDQKTRWGSSSGRGTISLNWRIVLLPEEVQEYLIIHELLHQRHHNHSSLFWKDVALFSPDYRTLDRWLKQNSYLMGLFR